MNRFRGPAFYIAGVIGLGVIYHLAARLGLLMANVQPNTSPVWPPTGIAIAALLLFGIRYWPGIVLGLVFGVLFTSTPLNIFLGLTFGNTLEAVAAAYLLTRIAKFHNSLDRIQDVISLTAFGALATTISATIGVITLLLIGSVPAEVAWTVWATWWLGDFMGALVITPFLLVWFTQWPVRWTHKKVAEALAVLIILVAVTAYVFTNQAIGGVTHEALLYVIIPFVIYAALRFTQLGAVNAVTLVSGIAIFGTAISAGPLVRSSLNDSLILLQTFMGVVTLTALTLAATTHERQSAEEAVYSGNERLHALSYRLMEVQESERLNLSRELHDETGQVLSAMMVQLGLLERDVENPSLVREHADGLKQIAADVLNNLHDMAVRLRPASLDHLGLVTALDQYIMDFGSQHHLDVQFESVGFSGERHPIEIETALFRVVQESLTNVLLHAQATRVDVVLSQRKRTLNVIVEDNGVGFIPENIAERSRLGLFGMRERVEMLGGSFSIESTVGQGTTIQVEVPCGN